MHRFASLVLVAVLGATVACGDDPIREDDDDGAGAGTSTSSSGSGAGGGTTSSSAGGMGAGGFGTGGNSSGGASSGGADGSPSVNLSASGDCSPMFDGTLSVTTNSDSLAVYSQNGGGTDSSLQVALQGATGLQALSTQHRIDTQIVVNLIDDGGTWTNIASFDPDPVTGTMDIVMNDQANGEVDLVFSGATLVLTGTQQSFCTITGTVQTYGEFYGQ